MSRTRFQGVRTVARFNWPLYLAAGIALGIALTLMAASLPPAVRLAGGLGATGAVWFVLGSLAATHWVYDRSDLYRWNWLRPRIRDGCRVLVTHTGFDEVSEGLRQTFPDSRFEVLDHFDPETMTEPSIRRARALHPPPAGTLSGPYDRWPELTADLILAPLAIHELRTVEERAAWFREARGALRPEGRILIVEHLRDFPNFLAFGPGFVHFHTEAAWRESWSAAGLELEEDFPITPFVRVFTLK